MRSGGIDIGTDPVTIAPGMRWASRAQFFCSGFIFATWGVHIPTVKAHYAIDEAQLGFAMLAAGIGALIGVSRAGGLIDATAHAASRGSAASSTPC